MRRILLFLLVLLAAVGVDVERRYRSDLEALQARVAAPQPTLQTTFGTLEYAELGEGEPLLGIHGTGGGYDQGLEMIGPIAERGYRLIAPSRFGYLGSSIPDNATVAMQADAFAELLDALDIDRTIILGGSAGALSAMQLAIRHPERCRALVLLVPAAYAPQGEAAPSGATGPIIEAVAGTLLRSDFLFWSLLKTMPDALTQMLLATDPALVHAASASEQARVHAVLEHILPVSRRTQGLAFDRISTGNLEPMRLDDISCPVLTISSRDDMFGTAAAAEYIARNVIDGRAVIFPSGGHTWVGHEADVWQEVTNFLGQVQAMNR